MSFLMSITADEINRTSKFTADASSEGCIIPVQFSTIQIIEMIASRCQVRMFSCLKILVMRFGEGLFTLPTFTFSFASH